MGRLEDFFTEGFLENESVFSGVAVAVIFTSLLGAFIFYITTKEFAFSIWIFEVVFIAQILPGYFWSKKVEKRREN